MTHPLTPREKVVAILDEHTTVGGTSAYRTGCINSDELAGLILTALASGSGDHAELARLAKEVKRTSFWREARDARDYVIDEPCDADDYGAEERPVYSDWVRKSVLALLAEIAALRAEREGESDAVHAERQRGQAIINERDQWIVDLIWQRNANAERATEAERALAEHRIAADLLVSSLKSDKAEAERKRAEAEALLIELADAPQPKDTSGRFFRAMSSINAYVARLNASKLSKEAERG